MKTKSSKTFLLVVTLIFLSRIALPVTTKVNSVPELRTALEKAVPGDLILVSDGSYDLTEPLVISKSGTADHPIVIAAAQTGKAEIKGTAGFRIEAPSAYIVVCGFVFRQNAGTFTVAPGVTHCRIIQNVFECPPVNTGTKPYISVSGDDNEISHNTFQNKKDEGQMVSVQGPGGDKMAKRTWIHHNYFFNFPPKANNCSAIQVGLSGRSMDSAFCIVEYNLFVKCAGENEGAICNKACNNVYRYNTFGEGTEELSLRHGNHCEAYGNFFLGSTGLRFSGDDHRIYSNYFSGCSEAVVCTNGDGEVKEGSKLTCHDRSDRVEVIYNTFFNCRNNYRMPSRKDGLGATKITFANNLIQGGSPVTIQGSYVNPVWKDNVLWKVSGGDIPSTGFRSEDPGLKENDYRMNRYGNIPASNKPLTLADVGPDPSFIPVKEFVGRLNERGKATIIR